LGGGRGEGVGRRGEGKGEGERGGGGGGEGREGEGGGRAGCMLYAREESCLVKGPVAGLDWTTLWNTFRGSKKGRRGVKNKVYVGHSLSPFLKGGENRSPRPS